MTGATSVEAKPVPPLQAAWVILHNINVGLKFGVAVETSDTALRVHDSLVKFSKTYTDQFITFAKLEAERADPASQPRAAPTKGLRRTVGPLLDFRWRVEAAIDAAEKEVAAYDLDSLSQSLRQADRESQGRKRVATEEPDEVCDVFTSDYDPKAAVSAPARQTSPTKRRGETFESPLTKSFRAVASTSAPSRASRLGPLPPPLLISKLPREAKKSRSTSPIPEFTTVPDRQPDRWAPLLPRAEAERYLLVTPQNPYQAFAFNHDIRFHTQWELEYALDLCGLSYDDIRLDQLGSLDGPTEIASAKIAPLLEDICTKKGDTEAAEIAKKYGQNDAARRLRHEVDREEEELSRARKGKGKEVPIGERPYGGKISYAVLIDHYGARSKNPRPDESAPWIRPPDIKPTSPVDPKTPARRGAGPQDDLSNPLGIASKAQAAKKPSFLAFLDPPQMPGKSSRIARELGPGRVITLKIPPKASQAQLRELLEGTVLVVLGRPFRALWAHPDGQRVYAVETNDVLPKMFARRPEIGQALSFAQILDRFNALEQKPGQAIAKWGSRLQIFFTDSVPIMSVDPKAMTVIPDVVSSSAPNPANPATEEILTDGCGLMSRHVARQVYIFLSRNGSTPPCGHPSAIQIRFGGSKGMLIVMTEEQEKQYPGIDIALRPSLMKALVHPRHAGDTSHFTLNLVRWTSLKVGVGLSAEPMPILVDRGVPKSVFVKLQENVLDELKVAFAPTPQTGESEADAARRVRENVYRLGGVGQDAKKRECKNQGKSQKVAGLTWKDVDEEEKDVMGASAVDMPLALKAHSEALSNYDVCPVSGQPYSIAEALYNPLCAGFHPTQSAYTAGKLRSLVKLQCETIVNRFRLPVPQSLSAFIIPDPLGILAPNEIHICTDEQLIIDPATQQPSWCLLGPVLALRVPCKLPTDIKKMVAVYRPELAHLRNVIVMSANAALCARSPASDLSGGDYDGDTVTLYWDPELVGPFQNADEAGAVAEPGFIEANFEKTAVTGTEVLEGLEGKGEEDRVVNLQRYLLAGLGGDVLTAKYSDWHGNAQYTLGVSHPATVRLGRMSGLVLDARKSGLQVREDVFKRDADEYDGEVEWRCVKKGKAFNGPRSTREIKRPHGLGQYVMDKLYEIGKERINSVLASFPEFSGMRNDMPDHKALSGRIVGLEAYVSASPHSESVRQLALLQAHVKACYTIWEDVNSGRTPPDSILEQYRARLAVIVGNAVAAPPTPMTPRRKTTPYAPETDETRKLERRIRQGNMRELARVWRDEVGLKDLGALCVMGLGEEWVRELKVSSGAEVVGFQPKQVFVFDMDYITACSLRAKMGTEGYMTVREEAWNTSRPKRRAM